MDNKVEGFLQHFINHAKGLLAEYVPKLAAALAVLFIGLWLANRIKGLITRSMRRRDMDPGLQSFIPGLIVAALKVLLFVTVAGMVGIQTTSFIAVLGAAGLAIGMALQGSLANFAGGVLILIFKPFRVGDIINAQGQSGTVKEIQIFHTVVVSGDNKTIIVPNGVLSNGIIINNTVLGTERFDLSVIIDGGNNLEIAQKAAREACSNVPSILSTPAPAVSILRFNNDDIELLIQPFVVTGQVGSTRSALIQKVKDSFEKNGIAMAKASIIVKQPD